MEGFQLLKSYRPRRLARWLGEPDLAGIDFPIC
jgi:hypothetical protein